MHCTRKPLIIVTITCVVRVGQCVCVCLEENSLLLALFGRSLWSLTATAIGEQLATILSRLENLEESWTRETSYSLVPYLERTHESLVYTHHCSSIVKLSTIVRSREQCHQLTPGKELVPILNNLVITHSNSTCTVTGIVSSPDALYI